MLGKASRYTMPGDSYNVPSGVMGFVGRVTYNYEEDKASWRAYVMQGWVPKWMYFVKFEGMSEEEAKAMTAEADAAQIAKAQLFGAE